MKLIKKIDITQVSSGNILDTMNVTDTSTNAPSFNVANMMGLPNNSIIEYDGTTVPDGYEEVDNPLLDYIYPVGSIYMSVNNVSPSTFLGGTWEQIQDTFLLAAGSTYSAGSTGGNATATLQLSNLPGRTMVRTNNASNSACTNAATTTSWSNHCLSDASMANTQPFSILPPYLAVYMWKRTA